MARSKTPSFLETALPEPGHPENTPFRTLSSFLIALFLLVATYLALTTSVTAGDVAKSAYSELWLGSWVFASKAHAAAGSLGLLTPGLQQWPEGVEPPVLSENTELQLDLDEAEVPADARAPDYNRFVWHRDLQWDPATAPGRLIVIGDVHGMIKPLRELLSGLAFNASADTLVFVGDLVAKSPIEDSLAVVAYVRELDAQAVRGNHDQRVIGFRSWMEWNGAAFSELAVRANTSWLQDTTEPSALRTRLPKGWKWRSQHFEIARRLPSEDYRWLEQRSLTLHIKSLHIFIVHAGMLPTAIPRNPKQQAQGTNTSIIEDYKSSSPNVFTPTPETERRLTAEDALLLRKQNRHPSTLLEMRGVSDHGTHPHADGHRGRPWTTVWEELMSTCDDTKASKCRPLSIFYGHWAARGLHIEPHSFGLDSACVGGGSLSALVIEPESPTTASPSYAASLAVKSVEVAGRTARVFSLRCRIPRGEA